MLGLFTQPQAWSKARSGINAFKFYEQHLISERPADPAARPTLPAFGVVGQLRNGASRSPSRSRSSRDTPARPRRMPRCATTAIRNVELRGGSVRYLAMDEPLLGAGDCKVDLAQAAKNVAAFAPSRCRPPMRRDYGNIEPYPQFGVPTLTAWMAALKAESRAGLPPPRRRPPARRVERPRRGGGPADPGEAGGRPRIPA